MSNLVWYFPKYVLPVQCCGDHDDATDHYKIKLISQEWYILRFLSYSAVSFNHLVFHQIFNNQESAKLIYVSITLEEIVESIFWWPKHPLKFPRSYFLVEHSEKIDWREVSIWKHTQKESYSSNRKTKVIAISFQPISGFGLMVFVKTIIFLMRLCKQ